MKSDETMNYLNLIRGTVLKMNQATFAQWKDALAGQYIVFSVIAPEEIDQEIMAEKLCDYFEKAELKTESPLRNLLRCISQTWIPS
ncbi:MAG: hypothetical protein ACLS4A_01745 [Oscillospiraceae bacterium]